MAIKLTIDYVKLKLTIDTDFTKSVLTYTNLEAADIVVDADSKNLYFSSVYDYWGLDESEFIVTLTDSFSKVMYFNRAFTEAYQLTDVPALSFSTTKTESLSLSEAFSKVVAYSRTYTDSISPTESSVLDLSKITTDSFEFTDSEVFAVSKKKNEPTNKPTTFIYFFFQCFLFKL